MLEVLDVRDADLLPRSWRSPGGGHGNPLQYSCLENPVDRGAWWVPVHGVITSQTWLKQLSMHSQYHHRKKEKKWSSSVVSDSLRLPGLYPTKLLWPWDSAGKSTGVGCHFLPQRIFLTQESNLGLPHCRQTLYHLSHQGSQYHHNRLSFFLMFATDIRSKISRYNSRIILGWPNSHLFLSIRWLR